MKEGNATRLGLWFREDDHGKHFLKGREWSLHPTVRGHYLGTIAKGWWTLGNSSITDYFELEVAVGGEDGMVQAGVVLPFLGRVHVGVKVPRRLLKGWIYQRREWTLRVGYAGRWLELLIASDENMRDTGMVDYYRRKRQTLDCANCRHLKSFHENTEGRCITLSEVNHGCEPCDCPGYAPEKLIWSRAALWPGWHLTFAPRLKDRLLGRLECTTTEDEPFPVVVPMPEGNYPGKAKREVRVWQRKRWPFSRKQRVEFWVDMDVAVPVPGKGENSWDIDDDGIYGTGGPTVSDAIANVTKAALRDRARYGPGDRWVPDAGWPEGIGTR